MNLARKRISALSCVLISIFIILSGCSKTQSLKDTSSPFHELTDELFEDSLTADALSLHFQLKDPSAYGLSLDEYTFGRLDLEDFSESLKETDEMIKRFKAIDPATLTKEEQINREIILDSLETGNELNKYPLLQEPVNPLTGQQAMLPILMNEYTFYTKDDVEHYLLLLKDTPEFFKSILEFEQSKAKNGTFMTASVLDSVLDQCKSFAGNIEENLMVTTFPDKIKNELPDMDQQTRDHYINENKKAVEKYVIPAYKLLYSGLEDLKASCSTTGPLCTYENGKAYYEALAKSNTGTDMNPDEMIALLDEKMQDAIIQMSLVAAFDPEMITQLASGELSETIDTPENILKHLQEYIKKEFPEAADVSYNVKYVDQALREYLSPAFYIIPPIDDFTSNKIYINSDPSETENIVNLFTTLAHEGYPGHLYQTTYYKNTNPDKIRAILDYSGYSEGWAIYVEMLSYDWAYKDYGDNAAPLMRANQLLSLYLSARVDIGVHYEGWTKADLKQYLSEHGMLDDDEIVDSLYDIVLQAPANYLSYAIGHIMFDTLRQNASDTLDDRFNPKEFHRFILEFGPAPFDLIEKHMNEWMKTQ